MRPGPIVIVTIAALLALTTLGLAVALLQALQSGQSELPFGPRFEIAAGYDRRAAALVLSPDRTDADLATADALSTRALGLYPYDIGAILRQAQIETLVHRRLTERAIARLRTSYDLVAIDPSLAVWRTTFCLEFWAELPADVRASAQQEFLTIAQDRAYLRKMREQIAALEPGPGRLVGTIWIRRLSR